MRSLSIAGAIASVLVAPAAARAGGAGVVTLAPSDQRAAVTTALVAAMREGRDGGRLVDDALADARTALAAGAVPVETLQRFRRVREQIDEGWRAYHAVQLDFAASRLAAARTDAEALVALPGAAPLYADASLRLGAVLAQLGRIPEARDAIALGLALDPDRAISPLEFAPETVAAIDAVRALPRPTHAVRIASEPPGAVLSIDGRDAGRTPATVELAVGQHVVVARAPLHRSHAQAVAIEPATAELSLLLDRDDDAARLAAGVAPGMPDPATQELADTVVRFADLDEVVLAAETERSGGPTLLLQRCAGVPARCTAVVELGYADRSGIAAAARSAWQAVRAAELRYPPSLFGDARVTGTTGGGTFCRVCRNPYVLAGAGAVIVAGTIAIIAIATASKPPPVLGVDPGQFTH